MSTLPKTATEIPNLYLSASTNAAGKRMYRVIHHGGPLCRDTQYSSEAKKVFLLASPKATSADLYEGDTDTWRTVDLA